MNYAQKVGENKAAAKLMIKLLSAKDVPIVEISPSERRRADKILQKAGKAKVDWKSVPMPTKLKAGPFNELTGYDGSSSEHSRDAITMAYDKGVSWIKRRLEKQYIKAPASYPRSNNDAQYIVKRDEKKENYLN